MRWSDPSPGDTRIITRFLLLPRWVAGEWRWLERARIKQEYYRGLGGYGWISRAWVD